MNAGATGSGLDAGASSGGAAGGSTGAGATAGLGGPAGAVPNGGVSLLGQLASGLPLPAHDHELPSTGGVIDYARLLVSPTAPPAPASPSDAFWLHPTEQA